MGVKRVARKLVSRWRLLSGLRSEKLFSAFPLSKAVMGYAAALVLVVALPTGVLADTTSSISANFNGTTIAGGDTVWFTSVTKVSGLGTSPVTIYVRKSTITFTASGTTYTVPAPESNVTFSPSATSATISFDSTKNLWQITVPSSGLAGNTLLDAAQFVVPAGGLPGGIQNVKWQASFSASASGISLQWQWAAAVYTSFNTNYGSLGVKPVDDNRASQYQNSDHAGTPENYKTYVTGGATGGGGSNYTGGYSGTVSLAVPVVQSPTANVGGPYSAYVSKPISFDGSGSNDPDGYPLNYNWNFGDGATGTGATPSHTYSSAGTFTVTLNVDDGRGVTGTSSTTATVSSPPPPVITGTITPPPNASGWNSSSVTVSFTCTDTNVGIQSCPSPVSVTTQGANQVVSGTATNNAGVTATASVKVNIDETKPSISASVSPAPNSAGWNTTNATVSFSCSDTLSGIAQCPQPILVSSSGANQVIPGTATDVAGNTASTSVTLNVELTLPSIAASANPAANAQAWNNTNVTVSFTCTPSTSSITSCPQPQTVTTEGAGQAVYGTVTDAAGNSNTSKTTLNIAKTPPSISASLLPQANNNNWNKTPVTVNFNCVQTTAPLATCPQAQTVTTEGANQPVTGTVADVAGNQNSATAHVSIATTPPQIAASASPQPNAAGWNKTPVTVTFNCTQTTAPIPSSNCPAPMTVSTEGANQPVSGTVTDVAGNQNSATVYLSIATTPPQITASVSPPPNAANWNKTPVTVTFNCKQTTAPIASCPAQVTVSTEGANQPVTGTVTDVAGHQNSVTVQVSIATTPPLIVASVSPPPNAANWNKTPVTVTSNCTQTTAPITGCPGPVTVSTEGANQPVTGTTTDLAGNPATVSVLVSIDETPPTLSITSPADGSTLSASAVSVTGSVSDALSGVSTVTCNGIPVSVQNGSYNCSVTLASGPNTISVQASDVAGNTTTQTETVTFASGPTVTSFTPASAPVGTLITVSGTNFTGNGGTPQVTLNQQGGGTIPAPLSTASANSLSFVIPSGAATGPVVVTANGQSATSSSSLVVIASSTFTIAAAPGSATLLSGQTTTYQVSLASTNGFSGLATLSVSGLPASVSSNFQPPQITAGQFSILTLTAPPAQSASSSQLTISANASVQGISLSSSATVSLNVQAAGNVAFAGRVAVLDPYDTPLVGLTVRFTGLNYSGSSTGCTNSTTTDSSGNFQFSSLPGGCGGSQLLQYDPSTVVAPAGKYSGVNLSYVLTPGQVTTPGIIVHLPRVDTAETVAVNQNSSTDQVLTFASIPNLTMVVYAGTTFTLADGTKPNPFPLSVVEIPYDRLPEKMQPDPTQDPAFAMSIEPFNSSSSQPVAVFYPNRTNVPPGTTMPLTSLNPTLGIMVNYGTGTVSADGTQIVPDFDPGNPGHGYGISHFDWHLPVPVPKNNVNPSPDPKVPKEGDPVDLASGLPVIEKTDIGFGGVRGRVALTRTYRGLSGNPGPFGIGTNHNYGYMLDTTVEANGLINLIMPDGNQFPFTRQQDGTYVNSAIPSLSGGVISNVACVFVQIGQQLVPGCSATLRWKNGTKYEFQPLFFAVNAGFVASYLMSITDSNGNTTTLVRNQSAPQEIIQITDPVGRSLNLVYDGAFRITSVTDPIGRVVSYAYNAQGSLATVADAGGGVTSYGYDTQNRLTSITDPRGITYVQNEYDQNGKVVKQTLADGGVTTFAYTQLNPVVSTSILTSTASSAAVGGNVSVTGVSSIPNINTSPVVLTTVTDPLGNQTTYHFSPTGFLLDLTDAQGQKTVYAVNPATNKTVGITDPLGRTTSFTYDSAGNTTSITRLWNTPNAVTTSFTYEPTFGKLASVVDPLGHTLSFQYDKAGNLQSKTDALGNTITFQYDSIGQMTAMTDPTGSTTQFAYQNGDVSSITDALGRASTFLSDAVDRTIVATNAAGQTSRIQYSPLNQTTQTTDSLGNSILYNYDGNGNLLGLTDANGHTTAYSYDSMDHLSTRTDPLGHSEGYQYDQNGNLTQFIDRRGAVTKYSYDQINRRIQGNFGGNETISYTYDARGRLILASDSVSGTIQRTFDDLDRVVGESTSQGSVSYAYDAAGRRTSMTIGGQQPVGYSYDVINRVTKITQGSSNVAFGYDGNGRWTSITLPNGVTMNYAYDLGSQLTGITYALGNSSLGNLTYSYDLAGRRSNVAGSLAGTGLPNRVSNSNFNLDNQPTQFGSATPAYDANGNLTNIGANSYGWNARNQLTSIGGAISATFKYDAFGRRVSKTVGNTETTYLYDGLNPVEELSGANAVTATMLTGLGVDQYFQRTDPAGTFSYLTDGLNSTIALTNPAGALQVQYSYDPYGNTSSVGSNSTNSFQYAARENDGTGLYFNRARYYSPSLARFISEDPKEFGGGSNLAAYVDDDPVNGTDPSGTQGLIDQIINFISPQPPPPPTPSAPIGPAILITQYGPGATQNGSVVSTVSGNPIPTFDPNGTTTLYPGGNAPPFSIPTLTLPTSGTLLSNPSADASYCGIVQGVFNTGDAAAFGGQFIRAGDPRGIHGGGTGLPDPFAPNQPLVKTAGCTRGANQDVANLANQIQQIMQSNPNVPITYCRFKQ